MKLLLICLALFGASYAQFSATAQTAILKAHNDFRSAVARGVFKVQGETQSAATNMLKMRWASTLASSAQDFANTCPDDRSGNDRYGENMYYAWSQKKPTSLDKYGTEAALSWQQELEEFGITSTLFDQQALDSGIKDATQMLWASASYVGCGVKNCGPDPDTFTQSYKIIVVCQYMEMGNTLDENIYEAGKTCSACSDFTECDKSTGLCE